MFIDYDNYHYCRKTDRKINFEQFQDGVKQIAEKKYPGDPNGLRKLESKINEGKGPKAVGVTVSLLIPFHCEEEKERERE